MKEKFRNITVKLMSDEATPVDPALAGASVFMKTGFYLNAGIVIANLANHVNIDSSFGELWQDIKPKDGTFTAELASELPYYLPDLDGKPDYVLNVEGSRLFVTNRMVRAFYDPGMPDSDGLSYLLVHRIGLLNLLHEKKLSGIHPMPMKTFLSRQFECTSLSAENAVRDNFMFWRDEFLRQVAFVIDALRAVDAEQTAHLLPHITVSSFPVFWLTIIGEDEKLACAQFSGEIGLLASRSLHALQRDKVSRLHSVLNKESDIPTHEAALSLARSFLHYGYLSHALIQTCTACEIFLFQKLRLYLSEHHVSKNYLDEYLEDVTFSQLLNLHLPSMYDLSKMPDFRDTLGDLNWARKRRNQIIHEGHSAEELRSNRVKEVIASAVKLIEFVDSETGK